jgi:predicted RNA-binding Zn-ribbon protein involved in translation (DUF1610 family)/antitoxin component of RelBE/YafQ-DinJ toxin-antitoxin module
MSDEERTALDRVARRLGVPSLNDALRLLIRRADEEGSAPGERADDRTENERLRQELEEYAKATRAENERLRQELEELQADRPVTVAGRIALHWYACPRCSAATPPRCDEGRRLAAAYQEALQRFQPPPIVPARPPVQP